MSFGPEAIFNMDEKGFMLGQVNKQHRPGIGVAWREQGEGEGGRQSRVGHPDRLCLRRRHLGPASDHPQGGGRQHE